MKTTVIKTLDVNTPCSINYFASTGSPAKKREWIKKRELYEADTNYGKRVVTPVTIFGHTKVFMMDAVTGSLYDIPTGKCLTSHMVYMKGYKKKPKLGKRLLSLTTDIHRGVL